MSNDSTFDGAVDALQRWYNDECRACACEILRECRDASRNESDVLHETIDGHEFIIYTFKAQLVIALSSHADAYEDEMGERASTDEARAYWAMRTDVAEYLDALRGDETEVAP